MAAQPLSHENLLLLVDDLLELEVLELIPKDTDPATMYIPYMMNDAVEYYLILSNCQIMGEIPEEFDGDTLVRILPGIIPSIAETEHPRSSLKSTRSPCRSSTMRALRSEFLSWSGIRRMPARKFGRLSECLVKRDSSDRRISQFAVPAANHPSS